MNDFLVQMQKYVAYTSVGASTVRGQRHPGLVAKLRTLLADVDLAALATCKPDDFPTFLNSETKRIEQLMPKKARSWGVARKVLNIFLRAATYNHYLRRRYGLGNVEDVLELPIDSLTAKGLRSQSGPRTLPPWNGVKNLTATDNQRFQTRAREIADEQGTSRVHLDIYLWVDRD